MKPMPYRFGLMVLICVFALQSSAPAAADDLEDLGVPVFRNRDGYTLAITAYQAESDADLIKGKAAEHTVSFKALIQPPDDAPVICFREEVYAEKAETDDGGDALIPTRGRQTRDYNAVLPSEEYTDRRGDPIELAEVELKDAELEKPGYTVGSLVVRAQAILSRATESTQFAAVVADEHTPIGRGMTVRVKLMEIDDKGKATIQLDMTRKPGEEDPILESIFAINPDGDEIGGGRWTEATDPFGDEIEVTAEFQLMGDRTISTLRVVLATRYEVVPVIFEVEDLFKQ